MKNIPTISPGVVVASGFVGKNLIQEARAGLKSREREEDEH